MFELIVSVLVFSILTKVALSYIQEYNSGSKFSATQIVSFFKEARARALATTLAYTLEPSGNNKIIAKYSSLCSSTTKTTDSSFYLDLTSGTTLLSTSWSICFNSRGFANNAILISVKDSNGSTRSIETVKGGATRLL